MKILYLSPGCFDKGGISRYNRFQITAMRDIFGRENVRVLSVLGPGSDAFETAFSVEYVANGTGLLQKFSFAMRALAEAVRWKPDLVFTAHVNLSGLARLVAFPVGARVILNVYGLEVWSGLRPDASWGLHRADLVVSDCHATADWLTENGHRSYGDMTVIWDCVDPEFFSPGRSRLEVLHRYGIPDPALGFNLLTFGRMGLEDRHKGFERLYQVFRRIAPANPNIRLIFAGRGALADELKKLAEADGLNRRVFFTGVVRDEHLPDLYRSAHLFSFVSDRGIGRGEGIPLTPIEAAACGLPILVGNQDGSREAVIPGESGILLDPHDLDAHARAILELSSDPARLGSMGVAGRRLVENQFTFEKFREKHRRVLGKWARELGETA